MIITTAMITGFKKEITNKIFGFWGHIHITDSSNSTNFDQRPIDRNDEYYHTLQDIETIEYQRTWAIINQSHKNKTIKRRSLATKGRCFFRRILTSFQINILHL